MLFAHRPNLCPPIDAYPGREPVELVICEAVFRYQLQQSLMDHSQAPRYYLALQGHDPDEALLRRLRELTPWVLPLSQCRVTARDGVTDRTIGARGMIVHVARLTWLSGAAADVVGSYYITHRHAAGLSYRVEHHRPDWAVTAVHLLWRA